MTRLVTVESPWKANQAYSLEQHKTYLEYALQDCFKRGEAPFASHGLYTFILDDDCLPERLQGIEAGLLSHWPAKRLDAYSWERVCGQFESLYREIAA